MLILIAANDSMFIRGYRLLGAEIPSHDHSCVRCWIALMIFPFTKAEIENLGWVFDISI